MDIIVFILIKFNKYTSYRKHINKFNHHSFKNMYKQINRA
ncbi:hypothetical protein SEVCU121_0484 [Staphylococcus warneri VCU121]|nr:hypothetical protein SEVCU121_0484 [Staphylococcus warneri VCU121]KEK47511.1 hypothetical protein AQ02_1986 [Staphylococcus warneri Lyso 1 2011]KEK52973.1 hypothetical protein AQ03_1865 [Staphylococcus warneri Lyso 2 2011]